VTRATMWGMRIDLAGLEVDAPAHPVYGTAGPRPDPGSRLLAEAAAGGGTVLAVNMAPDPALAVWCAAGARLQVQDERASAIAYARALLSATERTPGPNPGPVQGPNPGTDPGPRPGSDPGPDPRLHPGPDPWPDPRLHPGPYPSPDLRLAVAPELAFPPEGADVALVNLRYLWGRQPLRDTLAAALTGLRAGGRLLLAGANDRGVRSAATDLAAASGATPDVLAYGKGHRLIAAVRPAGWSAPAPASAESVIVEAGGVTMRLRRIPGLFAEGLPDAGTRLLVQTVPAASPGQDVLDLGCGGGAVAVAAALRQPMARVWATDDSLRAVRAAAANAEANGAAGRLRALHGDGFDGLPSGLRADLIAVNPPYHFGAIATTALAEQWLRSAPDRLRRGGRLYVVYNRFLPYLRVLEDVFGRDAATLLADADGYRVAGAVRD
jgi:16S rRNA (guanine1207-N2)-methyltransferase